ncbi:MAG: HAMP domain-containing sensor histidine kinase [Anaerolineaceae bacterium]|nr:HAMP domain-containing sensor histidine kinase [Anaerolineaceae bacterium]
MRTLRSRLILSHILPILIILPIMGIGLISLLRAQVLLSTLSSEMTQQAVLVASFAGNYNEIWYDPGRAEAFIADVSPSLMAQITLMDSTGRILVSSNPADSGKIGQPANIPVASTDLAHPQMSIIYSRVHPDEISDVYVPVVRPLQGIIGYVRLSNPFASIDASFQSLRQLIFLVMGAGLLAGIILGLVLAIQLERPLQKTVQAVYGLANGQRTAPLPEQGPLEVRTLAKAFNTLVGRLQTMEDGRRQLLANLVHELGRPIGALQSAVQALLGGADQDSALRTELLQGMGDELGRLKGLLNDLAHLHDQVLGTLELSLQPVTLEEWLPRVLAPWREAAQEKKQSWQMTIAPGLPNVEVDPDRFAQALGNLASNAVHYTPLGGTIQVEVDHIAGEVVFTISDSGPGVAPEEKAKIFTAFYRGKAARRFSDGMGLGLSIARDVVDAHGGELSVESIPGQGSRFIIRLPVE